MEKLPLALNRRRFLMLAGVSAAVTLLIGVARFAIDPRHAYVKAIVRERLHYLKFSEEVLNEFANDFVALTPAMNALRGQVASIGGVMLSRALGRIGGAGLTFKINAFEQKIASDFLKATDFFDEGADTERELEYFAFPDPYVNPCRNALAFLS